MENPNPEKLVDGKGLLLALFTEGARPSERWLRRQMKRRAVPYMKLGRLIRFDVDHVRASLTKKFTIEARAQKDGAS